MIVLGLLVTLHFRQALIQLGWPVLAVQWCVSTLRCCLASCASLSQPAGNRKGAASCKIRGHYIARGGEKGQKASVLKKKKVWLFFYFYFFWCWGMTVACHYKEVHKAQHDNPEWGTKTTRYDSRVTAAMTTSIAVTVVVAGSWCVGSCPVYS